LTRNSILQQAAISILSQANTQPQAALQLLQG
jgi:flagellin-like hook-associated protein FlgL